MNVRTRITALATSCLAFAAVMGGLEASPALAAGNANVYVSFPTWLGNCPGGGSVTGIYAAVGNTWSTAGDWGDDLIYPSVNLYQSNALNARVFCNRPWYNGGGYWVNVVGINFTPTRPGQTFWVGPAGVGGHN